MIVYIHKESELIELAKLMQVSFPNDTIFTLQGDLGAGKTTFVKAFCQYLQVSDKVSSPTFSLVNEYESPSGQCIFHMDLYRLEAEEELINIGFEEYLESDAICFIEWPEIGAQYLDQFVQIQIEILDAGTRKFIFSLIR